jgi:hypothetical protein
MTVQYKESKHPDTNETAAIERTDADGTVWSIPLDPANSDYQRYLAWLENPEAEQSTPIVFE